jgi:toxin ParE1/3/4
MKVGYRFSGRAAVSFRAISEYSRKTFGARRGRAYMTTVLNTCADIGRGSAVTYSCRDAFAPDLREELRFARAGRHFVIFVETPTDILIVDFLHQSADIARHLDE